MSRRDLNALIAAFARLPRRTQLVLLAVATVGLIIYAVVSLRPASPDPAADGPPPAAATTNADGSANLLFCVWNVENLFDDKDDRRREVDEQFDNAFAANDALRKLKYDRIASALLRMNGGKGPDIIACVEVESIRAAEILMGVLNSKVADPNLKYKSFAMKNLDAGRHIAPCVISRVSLSQVATKLHGRQLRILETHAVVNGYDLTILAAHWTSKLRQRDGSGGEGGRENYARTIHGAYADMTRRKPAADVLVCGDFNATPDEEEVRTTLGAVGDAARVKASAAADPLLLDLMANKPPDRFGTLWYDGRSQIYDHICVSPGMLDSAGWSCDPDSVQTVRQGLTRPGGTRPQPWRFGDPDRDLPDRERGFADHFPVVVRLTVQPPPGGPKPE